MKIQLKSLYSAVVIALYFVTLTASAQTTRALQPRITAPIDNSSRVTLIGSRPSRSYLGQDKGPVTPSMALHSITLDFSLTTAQKSELDALVAAQQDIQSPLYHQWLTPEQYGARFGVSAADMEAVKSWLQSQGFSIDRVARGSNHISFSGTAAEVEAAFGAPLHMFQSRDGSMHFAPARDLTVPAALASSVQSVRNLSNYLPRPHYIKSPRPRRSPSPQWTNISDPYTPYVLGPQDLATQYDINNAYKAGYTGAGQSIAVVGQSYILPSDVANFQTAAGVPTAKAPLYVLVPGTGTAERVAGDESESDLDVEYSSTIGKGAQVYFVYTGSYQTGVDASIQYAIDELIAPIITTSYGECEVDNAVGTTSAATEIADFDVILEQGVAQGQTILAAAGDDGSVDCIEDGDAPSTGQSASVDYPASSPYVTAMGGTEFPAADYTTSASTYWLSNTGSTPLVNSLKSYVPEQVWNDDDPYFGTSAGGGGASLYEAASTWQTPSVTNIIGGVAFPTEPTISTGTGRNKVSSAPRLVPDISLFASPDDPGMLVCSSDTSAWDTGQSGSCVNGFYDATNTYLTIFGGTSFDGPIFAGMLSIINQAVNSTGQGNVNSTLYSIAASSTATYNSAFHDITSGSNACYDFYETESGYPAPPAPMPAICGVGVATTEFSATTGYDLASGLGSVDLNNLITAWPRTAPGATLIGTITTLTPSTTTPALSTADTIAISVVSSTGNTVPTGTVSVSVDNVVANPSVPLISGAASYSFSSAVLGEHIVTVTYSDDTTHAKSVGVASLYVGTTTPSFTISASNATVAAGGSATTTVVITPVGGYTGSVSFTLTAPTTLANSCVAQSSASVTGGPVSTVFTIYTNSSNCPAGAVTLAKNSRESIGKGAQVEVASQGDVAKPSSQALNRRAAIAGSFAGLLLLFGVRRRSKLLRATASLALLVMLFAGALGLTGCVPAAHTGTVSTTAALNNASTGTYPITITANDSVNPTLTTSTTFTLTVQ